MATATCTVNGFKSYNGGWIPGSGYYSANSSNSGYGGGNYVVVYRFSVPAASGASSGRSLTIRLPWIDGGYGSSFGVSYYVTTAGPPNGTYSTSSTQGTVILSGSVSDSGQNDYQWQTKQFTTGSTGSLSTSGGTYYLWLRGGSGYPGEFGGHATITLNYTATTSVTAPTSVSVSASKCTPGGQFTISWSGASSGVNNSINGYDVYYGVGDSSCPNLLKTTSGTGTSTTTTIATSRGTRYYFKVRTRGSAGSSFFSGKSSASANILVNSLPYAPSVSRDKSTVPSGGGNVTFTVTKQGDPNGDSTTLYYSTSSGGSKTAVPSNNKVTMNMNSSRKTLYFYSYDGMEWSSGTSSSITVNTKPVINSISLSPTILAGVKGNSSANLVKILSASGSYNKTPSSYRWMVAAASTVGGINTSSYTTLGTGSTLSSKNVGVTKGYYYKIGLLITDAYESSNAYWSSTVYQYPLDPSAATISAIYNQTATSNVSGTSTTQFNNNMRVVWTNPSITAGKLNIQSSRIIFKVGSSSPNSSIVTDASGNTTSAGSNSVNTTGLSSYSRGYKYQLGVRITDVSGASADTFYSTIYTRAPLPVLSSTTLSASFTTIKPYTNTSTVSFSTANANKNSNNVNGVKWNLQCVVNGKGTINLFTDRVVSDTTNDTLTFSFTASQINSLLKNNILKENSSDSTWNVNYSGVIYRIYIKDNFGNTSSYAQTGSTNINFIESPTFASQQIQLGINYYQNHNVNSVVYPPTSYTTTEINNGDLNNDRMFNPGESIFFRFKLPTDYNDDISYYKLRVKRLDARPSSPAYSSDYTTGTFIDVVNFYKSDMFQNGDYWIYEYPVNSYTLNKFLIFSIQAIDSKNNASNIIYSNTYLVGCRKVNPTIELNEVSVTSSYAIKFNYTVSDLGGSQFTNSTYKYSASSKSNSYPNFERTISTKNASGTAVTYTKKAQLIVQYCLNGDFSNSSDVKTLTYTLSGNYSAFGGDYTTAAIDSNYRNKKIYVRIRLILSTGLGSSSESGFSGLSTVSSYSSVVNYYVDGPTVSHRFHHTGVNYNSFEDDDVLVISDFRDRRYIRLLGTSTGSTVKNYEILIDLKTGTINGATLDGGTWT